MRGMGNEEMMGRKKIKTEMKNWIKNGESGIYCLTFGDEVIYVGQSKNMRERVNQHLNYEGQIRERLRSGVRTQAQKLELQRYQFIKENFDGIKVGVLERCSLGKLDECEKYWIRKYRPRFNYEGVRCVYGNGRKSRAEEERGAW